MSQHKKRITSIFNGGVVIEDMSVYLPGIGSYADVPVELANSSKDLIQNSKFVKVTDLKLNDMPIWPLIDRKKPVAEKQPTISDPVVDRVVSSSVSDDDMNEIKEYAKSIKESLLILVNKEASGPSSESMEKMWSAINSRLTDGTSHSVYKENKDPTFIPSKITPDGAQSNFSAEITESKKDINDNINALKKLRKNR